MFIGYWWILSALFLLLIEIATPGLFFFISFVSGSIAASMLAFYGYTLTSQCAVFLVNSLLTFTFIRARLANKPSERLTSNSQALIGQYGLVTERIEPTKKGYIKLNGDMWSAVALDEQTIEVNEQVCIVSIKGNTVTVKKNHK